MLASTQSREPHIQPYYWRLEILSKGHTKKLVPEASQHDSYSTSIDG
jgi:hypothetical protein